MLYYTMEGTGEGSVTFEVTGAIEGSNNNPIDPRTLQAAFSDAFERVIKELFPKFGTPGSGGCRGPYSVTRFEIKTESAEQEIKRLASAGAPLI